MAMTSGDERVPPGASRAATGGIGVATGPGQFDRRGPTKVSTQLHDAREPGVQGVVRRLERDDQQAAGSVAGRAEQRLALVEQPAVRRPEATLGDSPRGARGILEALELERRRGSIAGSVLQPHPGLGYDTQRPFGSDQQ